MLRYLIRSQNPRGSQGFFTLMLTVVLSLVVVAPMIFVVSGSMQYKAQVSSRYTALKQSQNSFDVFFDKFNNKKDCTLYFKDQSFSVGDSNQRPSITIEVLKIDSSDDKNPIDLYQKQKGIHFLRATVTLGDLAPHIDPSKSSTIRVSSRDQPEDKRSKLKIAVYSEGMIGEVFETRDIYLEIDKDGKIESCTASPIAGTSNCKEIKIKKTCCRYEYIATIPNSKNGNEFCPISVGLHGKSPQAINCTYSHSSPKVGGLFEVKKLTTPDDPFNANIKRDCELSPTIFNITAYCDGVSGSWNYNKECVK